MSSLEEFFLYGYGLIYRNGWRSAMWDSIRVISWEEEEEVEVRSWVMYLVRSLDIINMLVYVYGFVF